MIRRASAVIAVVLFGLVFANLAINHTERQSLQPLAQSFVKRIPQELGTPNVVTGILLTRRAFDTLGEIAVLLMVAAGVGLVLGSGSRWREGSGATEVGKFTAATEIVRNGAEILVPLVAIVAAYIIMNGHLSAGGGFQGGAVIASGFMLLLLANPDYRIELGILEVTESLAGVTFVLVGIGGWIFADGFLDNRVLPLGQLGAFFSAGAIPLLSVLLGVKVGCELTVMLERFRG